MRDNSISNDGASSRPTAPSRNPGRARAEARLIGWIAAAGMLTGACVGLVVSGTLLARIELPPGFEARPLGAVRPKGKEQAIELFEVIRLARR